MKEEKINPEKIKEKINHLRDHDKGKNKNNLEFVKSLALVTSLGVTMITAIYLGFKAGSFLSEKYQNVFFCYFLFF
ncbi:MAG: AtpZ/AtpI family protein [Armatimonadetes bacterium]|nr:AtpZ/AtpI family protein [Armatimonadota bacterium]